MTSDPNEISEHFNEYFINLAGPNLAVKRPTSLRNFDSYLVESLSKFYIPQGNNDNKKNEVAREIDNSDANKSSGLTRYLQML